MGSHSISPSFMCGSLTASQCDAFIFRYISLRIVSSSNKKLLKLDRISNYRNFLCHKIKLGKKNQLFDMGD